MTSRPRAQIGLSLIELMVSITVSLMLVTGLVTLVSNSNQNYQDVTRASQQLENGRYAWHLLRDELQLAGFFGELSAPPEPTAALPDPCSVAPAVQETGLSFPLQGYNDPAAVACLPADYVADTDVLVIRRTSTAAESMVAPNLSPSQFYIQATPVNQVLAAGVAGWATGDDPFSLEWTSWDDSLPINHPDVPGYVDDPATTDADLNFPPPVYPYFVHIYFLGTDNALPTLKRVEVGPTGTTTVSLVEGVENMQFRYGIDDDDNGIPDRYESDTTAMSTTDWNNVMAIELHLLVRNLEPSSGHKDQKTYTLGDTVLGPFDDAYKRHVYSAAVRLNNPAGRRE